MSNYGTYVAEVCSNCGKINYVSLGNLADLTKADVEAWECWNCACQYLLDGAENWVDLSNANIMIGKEYV